MTSALSTALMAMRRQGTAVSSVLLSLAFMLFPVAHLPVFHLPVYWSEAVLCLAFGTSLVLGGSGTRERWRILIFQEWRVFFWAGLFLLGVFIAFFLNPHTVSDWGEMKSFYLVPVLLFFLLPAVASMAASLQWIVLSWALGTVAAALAGIVALGSGWLLYDGRLAGPYLSPNYLAMLLAPGVLMMFYFLRAHLWRYARFLSLLGLLIILTTLSATHSYTAWAALAVSSLVYFFAGARLIHFRFAILFFVLFAAIFFIQEQGSEKWEGIISGSERSSVASRIMIWRSAVKIATDTFPWGIGTGRFQTVYLEYQRFFPPYLEWAVPTPHNLFLHFFFEGGVLALLGWLGCAFSILKRLLMDRSVPSEAGARSVVFEFRAFVMALLLFYLVYGLVDTPYMKNDLALAVWGSLGLALAVSRLQHDTKESS